MASINFEAIPLFLTPLNFKAFKKGVAENVDTDYCYTAADSPFIKLYDRQSVCDFKIIFKKCTGNIYMLVVVIRIDKNRRRRVDGGTLSPFFIPFGADSGNRLV